MLMAGTPHDGIADVLGLDRRQVRRRARRIIARLRPRAAVSWAAGAPDEPPAVAAADASVARAARTAAAVGRRRRLRAPRAARRRGGG
jgi:hypothetical protein